MSIDFIEFEKAYSLYKVLNKEEEVLNNDDSSLIGKRVIVRSRNAGVMYGTLVSVKVQHVVLTNARMLWEGTNADSGVSLNDTAVSGLCPDKSKVSAFNTRLEMLEACSIIEVSPKAEENLDGLTTHKCE